MHDHYTQRMFPSEDEIPSYVPAIRELVIFDSIDAQTADPPTAQALQNAYYSGFVDFNNRFYTFASPLIRFQWQWALDTSPSYTLPFRDLYSLIAAVLGKFWMSQLSEKHRGVGADAHKPLEAQYQQEFYRSIHDLTNGRVRITPEYGAAVGTTPGRIDFFLPEQKWGIEMMRDGTALEGHAKKFEPDGPYGQWVTTNGMKEFFLVDCRTDYPRNRNAGMSLVFGMLVNLMNV